MGIYSTETGANLVPASPPASFWESVPTETLLLLIFALLCALAGCAYAFWGIRSGYVHVGDRLRRVYREQEPKTYWFVVSVVGLVFPTAFVWLVVWKLTQ